MAENNKINVQIRKSMNQLRWIGRAVILIAIIWGVRYIYATHIEKELEEMKYEQKVEWFGFRDAATC